MKFSRLTAAVTLTSALVLTACTGGDDPSTDATTSTAGSTAEDTAATAGPGDDAAVTSGDAAAVTDDAAATTAMTTDEAQAAMSVEQAEEITATLLEARHATMQEDGKKQRELAKKAYAGSALTAIEANDKLEDVAGKPAEAESDAPAEGNVLAISRADGEVPVLLLVQTVPESGVPVLHLLESSSGKQDDFRITWEAPMLPGTEIPSFDRRSVGTPVVRGGSGSLVENPHDTLKEFRAYISWPQPEEVPEFRSHGYSPAVRDAAEAQAAAVADQADLREKNWVISDDTRTLLFEDGSGFIIGSLLRDTTFSVKANSVLNAPETFAAFADDTEITEEAVLRTMVFLGMRVPAEGQDFKRELITAREQLVDAWGS